MRIFTVTGLETESTSRAITSYTFSGSRSNLLPASTLVIFGTGHPIFKSIISASVFLSTYFAASTNVSISPPKICKLSGRSLGSIYSIFIVFLLLNKIALSLTISAQTNPAPNSFAVKRNAALHTPAIGAKTTLFGISTSLILNILYPFILQFFFIYTYRFCYFL